MNDKPNILLVGFMGTGKSSVGRLLAHRLGMDLLDTDTLIEQRAGKSVSRIFSEDGERAFRERERAIAVELAGTRGHVIATGGGFVLNPANTAALGSTGLVVCLWAEPATVVQRLARDTSRPLLQGPDKLQKVSDLLEARRPLYMAIPHRVETDGLTSAHVASRIEVLYADYLHRANPAS